METKTITQEVFLNAIPHEVFEAYLDDKQHAEFTRLPAAIEGKPGGRFSTCGERLTGAILETENDRKIVQQWRGSQWLAGDFSQLSLTENHICRMVDGGIAEEWPEPSFHDLLAQLRGASVAAQLAD